MLYTALGLPGPLTSEFLLRVKSCLGKSESFLCHLALPQFTSGWHHTHVHLDKHSCAHTCIRARIHAHAHTHT